MPFFSCLSCWLHCETYDSSAAQAEIHGTKDNISTDMSTNSVTGVKEHKKINVCQEKLHSAPISVPATHPEKKKVMNVALNHWMYDITTCTVHNLQAADELRPSARLIQKPPESQTIYEWICYGNTAKWILRNRGSAGAIRATVYFQKIKLLLCLSMQVPSAGQSKAGRKRWKWRV